MLTAPFLLAKHVWPPMKAKRRGQIINMSSIHGLVASPFKVGYISAKHGLIGMTRAAALEGGQDCIPVNAMCPGWIRIPLVEGQLHDLARAQGVPFDQVLDRVGLSEAAIKRVIEREEIAVLVGFLPSEGGQRLLERPRLLMRASPLIHRQRGKEGDTMSMRRANRNVGRAQRKVRARPGTTERLQLTASSIRSCVVCASSSG